MRPIDADALKEGLKEKMYGHPFERIFLSSVVDSAHTIDAVPVVRCLECKHLGFCGDATNLEVMGFYGYCSRGERKEGADNG